MASKDKDNLFWIKWYYSESKSLMVQQLKKEFGYEGYGIYHTLVSEIGENNNLLSKKHLKVIERDCKHPNFNGIIDLLIDFELLYYQDEFLSSSLIKNSIELKQENKKKLSKSGEIAANARWNKVREEGKKIDTEARIIELQQPKPNHVTRTVVDTVSTNFNHSINNADSVENSFPTQINKFDIDESFFLDQRYSGNQEELISDKIIALNDYLSEDKQISMSQMQSWIQRHKTEKVLTVLNSMYEISQYIKSTNAVKLVSFVKKVLDGNGELSGSILQKKEVNVIEIEEKKIERLYNDYHELFVLYFGNDYKAKKLCYKSSICDLITEIANNPAKIAILKEMYNDTEILIILKSLMEQDETKKNLYIFMLTVNGQIRPTQMSYEKAYNYIKELIESN